MRPRRSSRRDPPRRNAKKVALLLTGVAYAEISDGHRAATGGACGICDVIMEAFAMESVAAAHAQAAESGKGAQAAEMCRVFTRDAMARVEVTGRTVLAACSEGDTLRANLAVLRRSRNTSRWTRSPCGRRIAGRLLDAERYVV